MKIILTPPRPTQPLLHPLLYPGPHFSYHLQQRDLTQVVTCAKVPILSMEKANGILLVQRELSPVSAAPSGAD